MKGGRSADAVIVGAGVIGASVAWHLASLGMRDLILLEREERTGLGSTGRATGGFRAQYGSDINIRLSLLSREKLRRFPEELRKDPGYLPCGYLWLARSEAILARLAAAQALQHRAGLAEARLLGPGEIAAVNPFVSLVGVVGAAHCPTDGFVRPLEILRGYLEAAQRLGARLITNARPLGFGKKSGRITSVETAQGVIETGLVVNAAGPWAREVAELAGVALPVFPLRRQVAATVPTRLLPEQMPMTLWADDGFHLRVRDGRVLLLLPTPGNPDDPFDTALEPQFLAQLSLLARERVPALGAALLDRDFSWAGLYEQSPDQHAILGPSLECPNFFLCNGSSGHGVMHAPALGQLLAEQIVQGGFRSLDASALGPSRFAEGNAIQASDVL